MKTLGALVMLAGTIWGAPVVAQPVIGGVHLGLGYGPAPCRYRCEPYYRPHIVRPYGPRFYGPPTIIYRDEWRPSEDRRSRWSVTRAPDETDFELPDGVLFDLDSAVLTADARDVITEIADAARDRPGSRLVIEGYTDTSGSAAHNQALSEARARAVTRELERQGVEPSRLEAIGYGETRLAVATRDEVREPRNRRVRVRLIGGNQGS